MSVPSRLSPPLLPALQDHHMHNIANHIMLVQEEVVGLKSPEQARTRYE
jgi:hypothetical protein